MPTTLLTAEVSQGLADRLGKLAAESGQAPGEILEEALAAWIDREDVRRKMTLEALAEVDSGRLIEHSAVRAWANSLGTGNVLPVPSVP